MTINFQKIVQGLTLPSLSSLPGDPVTGDVCNHNGVLKFYNGSSWLTLGAGLTNPMTTTGDIIYSSDNSGTPERLGIGNEGATLEVVSGIPSWVGGTPPASGRGIWAGGYDTGTLSSIDYVIITTAANAVNFGDLTVARVWCAGASSSTRGLSGGGSGTNVIDYVTIATSGNAIDFGDLTVARSELGALANSTRAVFAGGATNVIDYVTIASLGNATSFGNLVATKSDFQGLSSSTVGVFGSGSGSSYNTESITIATTGNSTGFGTLTMNYGSGAVSDGTRGVFGGGTNGGGSPIVNIEYITIASAGNGVAFGNLTQSRTFLAGTDNAVRGVFGGGAGVGVFYNTLDYITIVTTANATTFGNLTTQRDYPAAFSDNHGGL
jgi:hypothetical protein